MEKNENKNTEAVICPLAEPAELFSDFQNKQVSFSQCLTSPTISVRIGSNDDAQVFHLHYDLLSRESEMFFKMLRGSFKEANDKMIDFPEEEVSSFKHFVKYLYSDAPLSSIPDPKDHHESTYALLTRLYGLGERLFAHRFQKVVLEVFCRNLTYSNLPDNLLCEILEIAASEIPSRSKEDPLRDQIFWLASKRLQTLRKRPEFKMVLERYPELGVAMTMRASDSIEAQPQLPSASCVVKFIEECPVGS